MDEKREVWLSFFPSQTPAKSNSPQALGPRVTGILTKLNSENCLTINTTTKLKLGDIVTTGATTLLCILRSCFIPPRLFPHFFK